MRPRVRRLVVGTGGVLFAVAAMGADSCGDIETKDTADKPEAAASSTADSKAKSKKAGVGDLITIEGNQDGTKVAVRLLEIVDPVKGGQFDTPAEGNRYVGVKIRLKNSGSATYSDAPSNGAELIITGDEQAQMAIVGGGECGIGKFSSVKVSPGNKLTGCLAFEVPEGKNPQMFQFTLDSGFGPDNAEWTIK